MRGLPKVTSGSGCRVFAGAVFRPPGVGPSVHFQRVSWGWCTAEGISAWGLGTDELRRGGSNPMSQRDGRKDMRS